MQTIYGPIPSRRLGQSLGIDPIPLKTCNWNCIYCQLGRTVPLTNARREYVPRDVIMAELQEVLARHEPGTIDFVSFVGSGEPTLHTGIGWLIRHVKAATSIPVAVITNGSLLYVPAVRADLDAADVVMPTLVAGSDALYRRITRPHPDITFTRIVHGLRAFRRQYTGRLWVEVMLMAGINDTDAALHDLANVLASVDPDEVHITLPTRPPSEVWVAPPTAAGLTRATTILGNIAHVVHPTDGTFDLSGCTDVIDAIVAIITRHPISQGQLEQALTRWSPAQIDQALRDLDASGRARIVERLGRRFWTAVDSRFPAEEQSARVGMAPDARG